jgi:hypothetical protein
MNGSDGALYCVRDDDNVPNKVRLPVVGGIYALLP